MPPVYSYRGGSSSALASRLVLRAHEPSTTGPWQMRVGFPPRSEEATKRRPLVEQWRALLGTSCPGILQGGNFTCPQCKSGVTDLPSKCPTCSLVLLSSQHIARSYHHLFPVPPFEELPWAEDGGGEAGPSGRITEEACFACCRSLRVGAEEVVVRCPSCHHTYCFDCDNYIHDVLHTCPGCESRPVAVS